MLFRKCFVLFLFFIPLLLKGQVPADSLNDNSDVADTVIIYKEPLVINKTVTIYSAPVKKNRNKILVDLGGSAFSYYTYSNVCTSCQTYYDKIKKSTHALPDYTLGVSLLYKPGKFLIGVGFQYTLFKTSFNYTDSTGTNYKSTNTSKNTDLSGIIGYWFDNSGKKISFLPSFSAVYSKQGKASGELLALSSNQVENINNVLSYRPDQYSIGGGIKILYRLKSSAFFYLEPFYRYNLRSVVKTGSPYTIQRHLIGLKIGFLLGL